MDRVKIEGLIDFITRSVLRTCLYKTPNRDLQNINEVIEINKKIGSLVENTGMSYEYFKELNPNGFMKSNVTVSAPDEDTSMVYKEVAERIATGLGLELIINPADDFVAEKSHYIYYSQNFLSINALDNNTAREYISQNINKKISNMSKAFGGIIDLVDFAEVNSDVQELLLQITEGNRLNSLYKNNIYVGFSGKLDNYLEFRAKEKSWIGVIKRFGIGVFYGTTKFVPKKELQNEFGHILNTANQKPRMRC